MDAQKRRQQIAQRLENAKTTVSATTLAKEFSVSRQIIVGDIALLRASGLDITATPRGYLLSSTPAPHTITIACIHRREQMEEELNVVVDHGCTVLDVIVAHPVYGELKAPLHLNNRYEVKQFLQRCKEENATPLSQLTDGVHLHTISYTEESAITRMKEELQKLGILYDGTSKPT